MLVNLRAAGSFLTRIPLHNNAVETDMPAAVPWFPVIGALVGLLQGAVFLLFMQILPVSVAAVLSMMVATLVTGAFHQDGLADIADAFGGGWTTEQRMEILKDSRLGTYGVSALVLVFLLEAASLSGLTAVQGMIALVVAHSLSRSFAVAVMRLAPAAGDGLGAAYMLELKGSQVMAGGLVGLVVTLTLCGFISGIIAILFAALTAALVVALAVHKIGGINGDVLGAVQQVTFATILVSLLARWS